MPFFFDFLAFLRRQLYPAYLQSLSVLISSQNSKSAIFGGKFGGKFTVGIRLPFFILAVGLCLSLFYFIDMKRNSLPVGARSNQSCLAGCVECLTECEGACFTVLSLGNSLKSRPSARMAT